MSTAPVDRDSKESKRQGIGFVLLGFVVAPPQRLDGDEASFDGSGSFAEGRNMFKRFVVGAALGVAFFSFNARAAVLIIDDFSTFQSASQPCASIGSPVGSSVAGPGILGGERDIRLDITACTIGDLSVNVTSYFHSQDSSVFGRSLAAWDGGDGNGLVLDPTGLGGVDLTQGFSQDAIELFIEDAETNAIIRFDVYTNAGNSSQFTLSLPGGASFADFVIPYASFVTSLGAGADFTNVGAVTMLIDGSARNGLDVTLTLLQTTSTLTSEKTDALFVDADNNGLVNVGDTVQYTVTITNPDDDGNLPSQAVSFADTPGFGTDLVVGSVTTSQGTVTVGNTGGDTDVVVDIGNIADGTTVTITFSVTVNANGVPGICNQGETTTPVDENGVIYLDQLTDDPGTVDPFDPTCTPVSYCGDGILDPVHEECDDGNLDNNDACTNACTIARCGDGIVQTGVEECDDGDLDNTDECTTFCNNAECGDGFIWDGMEQCDDGNPNNNDGCTNVCLDNVCGDGFVETGVEQCDDGNLIDTDLCTNACTDARCGDGIVQIGVEQCDDGDLINDDECTNACTLPVCGDGIVQAGEECDDGNLNNADSCTTFCLNARCGDGFVQGSEECDDGDLINDDECTNACTQPRCGDGIVQAPEQCDDGNVINDDTCSNVCQTPRCGDGILQAGEQCDDGDNDNGDGCQGNCQLPRCGDGIVDPNEQCDDGNLVDDDGCSNACNLPSCGDGIEQPGEQCDDGNNSGGDGCSAVCRLEICGNNTLDPNEECDGTANAACDGFVCGVDCTCPEPPPGAIPTVSAWGLAVLTLLLATGVKLFARRPRLE